MLVQPHAEAQRLQRTSFEVVCTSAINVEAVIHEEKFLGVTINRLVFILNPKEHIWTTFKSRDSILEEPHGTHQRQKDKLKVMDVRKNTKFRFLVSFSIGLLYNILYWYRVRQSFNLSQLSHSLGSPQLNN